MKPKELIEGLRRLAMVNTATQVVFKVPGASTERIVDELPDKIHQLLIPPIYLSVTSSDVLDLVNHLDPNEN